MLTFSCGKEESNQNSSDEQELIETRSDGQGSTIRHTQAEIDYIQSVKVKVDAQNQFDFGVDFQNFVGLPAWNVAAVPQKTGQVFSSVIVPIIKANEINAFYQIFDGEVLTFEYVDRSLIMAPYFVFIGPANEVYDQIFTFYDNLLSNTPFGIGNGYDDIFIDNQAMNVCTLTTTAEVGCSCVNHSMAEECNCGNIGGGSGPYIEFTTVYIACNGGGGSSGGSNSNDVGGSTGSGSNGGGNNTNAKKFAAKKYAWSVCPIISQEACSRLKYIIDKVSNSSSYCLNISKQVAELLEDPTTSNIAAANCFIMSTSVNHNPSAPNTCSNPYSLKPLSDFAEMYNEMDAGLLTWVATYPSLSNVACSLTGAGYTSEEKNQILQAFNDYLGNPTGIGIDDIPTTNPEMDNVNALNSVLSSSYYPELIELIPIMLEWDSYDNVSEIANFIRNVNTPLSQNSKSMLTHAAKVSDKAFLNEILTLVSEDEEPEGVLAASMAFVSHNNSSIYGPYDLVYHTKINQYVEANITDPTLMVTFINYFTANCASLKKQNPDWKDSEVYWQASKELIHLAFDLAGLIPGAGEAFDFVNGVMYTIEGDGVNATLSFAAMVPIAGWYASGTKFVIKGKLALVVKASGVVDFGSKQASKFRAALGLVKGDGKHAHHIIPWDHKNLEIVQRAAKSDNAFHINEVLNGITISASNHLNGHKTYNTILLAKLESLNTSVTSNNDAFTQLKDLIDDISGLINKYPNKNLDQIADLIN